MATHAPRTKRPDGSASFAVGSDLTGARQIDPRPPVPPQSACRRRFPLSAPDHPQPSIDLSSCRFAPRHTVARPPYSVLISVDTCASVVPLLRPSCPAPLYPTPPSFASLVRPSEKAQAPASPPPATPHPQSPALRHPPSAVRPSARAVNRLTSHFLSAVRQVRPAGRTHEKTRGQSPRVRPRQTVAGPLRSGTRRRCSSRSSHARCRKPRPCRPTSP